MSKTKQISFSKIDKIIDFQSDKFPKDNKTSILYNLGDEEIEIVVTPLLSISDTNSFVTSVVDALFDGDTYIPSIYKLIVSKAILAYYTNIKFDLNDERITKLVYQTDIIDKIVENINMVQFKDISDAISELIEFKKKEILSTQKQSLDKAIVDIETYVDTFADISKQFSDVDKSELIDIFRKIASKDDYSLSKATLQVVKSKE